MLALSVSISACKSSDKSGEPVKQPATATPRVSDAKPKARGCRRLPFAEELPIAEASGAVVVAANKVRPAHILVVGDSGTGGQFNEIAATDGRLLRAGKLPLDSGASDDLEGLTRIGDTFYVITSSGWLRHYRLDSADQYQQVQSAYAIADRNRHPRMTCRGKGINCAKNYEGLCLAPDADKQPAGTCIGFAASKADGHLYCLSLRKKQRLRLDPRRRIKVTNPGRLTGCHFSPDGATVYAGANLFGRSEVVAITGWQNPDSAQQRGVGSLGSGFPEALAVAAGGIIYRFSDTGGKPSFVDKYKCD